MSKNPEKGGIPSLIGEAFAHVQHGLDKLTEWGFETMKNKAESTPKKEPSNPYVRKAQKAGLSAMKFLGKMGSAYYKTYDELKKKNS